MTSTIETSKRVAMLATVGGIGSTAAVLIAAGNTSGGFHLSPDFKGATKLWEIATAGVFWAVIFNWLFENYIWRLGFLQGWLVKVPDLSGVWTGTSESRIFKEKDGKYQTIPMEARIDHRFERIVYKQQGLGTSLAHTVDLSVDENGFWKLTIVYHNLAQTRKAAGDAPEELTENVREHDGCAIMTLNRPDNQRTISKEWKLSGPYWTNKSRSTQGGDLGTTGVMDLRWNRH
jgi:hypothetical protein